MNTARHFVLDRSRTSRTLCEALESRQLLSAADIDLANLIARSEAFETQTIGIIDSAGNQYSFWNVLRPDAREFSPEQMETHVSATSSAGDLMWSAYVDWHATIMDMGFGPDGSLYVAGRYDNRVSGMCVWRFGADGSRSRWNFGFALLPVADIAVDAAGNAVLVGRVEGSPNWRDVLVLKVGPSGPLWRTRVSGSRDDLAHAIAISSSGEIVVGGVTTSTDLEGAQYGAPGGSGVFLSRLDASGQLIGSAYVNGSTPEQLQAFLGAPAIQGTEQRDMILVARTTVTVGTQVMSAVQVTINSVVQQPYVRPDSITIGGLGGNDTITIDPSVTIPVIIYGGDGDDRITSSSGNSSLYGGSGNDFLTGRAGNDLIEGGEGADTLVGGDGKDTLYGHDGNDSIHAGLGDDELYGNNGNDTLIGGGGNDYLAGQADGDRLLAGGGNDSVSGGLGSDFVSGEDGVDTLLGGDGRDSIYGGPGADHIEGKGKSDTLHGGMGNDTIVGGAGSDLIFGEDGDDTLDASVSSMFCDTIRGGAGHDLYSADGDDVLSEVEDLLS